MAVDTPRKDYNDILPKWQRLRDCFKGRDAVIKAGIKYLPLLPGASIEENTAYRARGNFYNALGRTVDGMNGSIFQEAPEVEMPESSKEMLDDITLTDMTFESFITEVGKEVLLMGRHGVLIDMPVQPPANLPQRAEVDMRPYCVSYNAEDIVNWRTERRGGDSILTMVVLREDVEVPVENDPFTLNCVCQYRVVMLKGANCVQQLWRPKTETQTSEYEMFGPEVTLMRRGEALTFVPFIFFNALRPSPDLEAPPLLDLCDVNLGHWRNSCDYEHGLHLVALPTPWMAGAKGGTDGPKAMGPGVVWELEVNGSAGMLEFTGEGLKAIFTAMDEKRKQMASLGGRLLEDAQRGETATAVQLRHSSETASLKTIAQSLEQGMDLVLQICLWWEGTDAQPGDTEVDVELNKEYLNIRATPQEVQVALTALQAGEISFETWYNILQSGGWAREGVDSAAEQKDIATRQVSVVEPPNPASGDVPPPPITGVP